MSPLCHINFVPKLYTGAISDKEIFQQSGFLDYVEPGDIVMADKGFNIRDFLALKSAVLIAPLSCQVEMYHHMVQQQQEEWQHPEYMWKELSKN